MLNLDPNEKVLLVLHHHWISFLGPAIILTVMLLVPAFLIPTMSQTASAEIIMPFIWFATTIWYLFILFLALGFWMDFYLDAFVITDKRILNITQSGLFRHVVSEFRMDRVQDVTIEVPNFLATYLNFGNIKIHTAGEVNFSISEVPSPHAARDFILKHTKVRSNL